MIWKEWKKETYEDMNAANCEKSIFEKSMNEIRGLAQDWKDWGRNE